MKRPDPFWRTFALCGAANFFVFWGVGMLLGGVAFNGTEVGGHYYLANQGHMTEVSRGVWIYSSAHAFFTITTFPILFILGLVEAIRNPPDPDARFRGVRSLWRRLKPRPHSPEDRDRGQ